MALLPPDGAKFRRAAAVSPDGRWIATTARKTDGPMGVWLRALDSTEIRMLPDSTFGRNLVWSPDSRFLAYATGRDQFVKVSVPSGAAQLMCTACPATRASAWTEGARRQRPHEQRAAPRNEAGDLVPSPPAPTLLPTPTLSPTPS